MWLRDEAFKVGKNHTKGRFLLNWSNEFVIVPTYYNAKKSYELFTFGLRSESVISEFFDVAVRIDYQNTFYKSQV